MIRRYGRHLFMAVALLLLVLLPGALLWAGERTETGVVVKSGFSGVIVQAAGSPVAVKYHTGGMTVLAPGDYRPMPGDTVTVRFHSKLRANGQEIQVASALSLVKADSSHQEISSPAVGIVQAVGWKRIRFEFPGLGQVLTMEMTRGTIRTPEHWRPRVGDKVRVFYKRVQARFVRRTVMVINRMENLD